MIICLHENLIASVAIPYTTPFRTYCYVRIPEGLCNAGYTFNRMIKKVLGDQLGRNVSTYVDDVVV